MNNFTTETYTVKREILTFAEKLSCGFGRPDIKFISDMIYGMIASQSVLLSNIADALCEDTQKINTVDRLSKHLSTPLPRGMYANYITSIKNDIPDEPIVLLDDSDVIKPYGKKFEDLGRVKDGSASGQKVKLENGYWISEAVVLSKTNHPISLFSHVFSQNESDYKSNNTFTYRAIDASISALGKRVTFVCDRGHDSNETFKYFYAKDQQFIIRLTQNRKLFYKGKWISAPTLCKSRKGKFKTTLKFQDEDKECYISHINVQITASKKPIRLVLVYGLSDKPMMLATNIAINGKDDVVKIARTYLSRWRIEEYFRFKKQHFGFEDFRVRNLKAINNLNRLLSYAITFMNKIISKKSSSNLLASIYARAKAIRSKVLFHYYRVAKGIAAILSHAKTGIRGWYNPLRIRSPQICLKLNC
jgi:hypothetical protein